MKILENQAYPELANLSLGKYRISLYKVSGGRADAIYGDYPGSCYPCSDQEALQVAQHLKAVNPVFIKLYDGSAWLIADNFPPIQEQTEREIKALKEPNGSGIGYEYYSVFVYHPIFWGGSPIAIYENKKFDFRGYAPDAYWSKVEKVCEIDSLTLSKLSK